MAPLRGICSCSCSCHNFYLIQLLGTGWPRIFTSFSLLPLQGYFLFLSIVVVLRSSRSRVTLPAVCSGFLSRLWCGCKRDEKSLYRLRHFPPLTGIFFISVLNACKIFRERSLRVSSQGLVGRIDEESWNLGSLVGKIGESRISGVTSVWEAVQHRSPGFLCG